MIQLNKTIRLAALLSFNASLAMAQDGLPPMHMDNAGITASKSTGAGSRLIAQSHYNGSFATPSTLTPYDSQKYTYPNTTTNLQSQMLTLQYGTAWVLMRKNDYTYNSAGKMTYMIYQNWGPNATAYTPAGQTFFTLNAAGYCIKDSNQVWLTSTSAYRNNTRNTYTVSSAGQVTDQVYQNWDAGSSNLINYYHYTYAFNTQGKLAQQTLQDWDATAHWLDYSSSTYAYDATGTKVQTLTGQQRIGSTPGLQNVYQNVYTLDASGRPTVIVSNLWNSSTSAYAASSRVTYTYDAAGNNITSTNEQWNAATNAYKPSDQYVYTYNSFNQMTSSTRSFWNGTAYAISSNSTRYNYYYEPYTTGTTTGIAAAGAAFSATVYPTICNSSLFVDTKEPGGLSYNIVSSTGAMTVSGTLQQGNNTICVADLSAGMYMLQIQAAGNKGTYRFIKQ